MRNDAVAKETFERVRLLEQMVRELDACKMTTSQQQELDKRIEAVERLAVHTNNLSTDLLAKQKEVSSSRRFAKGTPLCSRLRRALHAIPPFYLADL